MKISLGKFAGYAKAIAAFIALLVPLLTVTGQAIEDGVITIDEAQTIAVSVGAVIGGTGAVYQVRNRVQ